MQEQFDFFLNRIRERLWIKPLIFCLLSIGAALLAHVVDNFEFSLEVKRLMPDVTRESIEELLKITAASMLVIATFAVSAMVSAYANAARTATPRAFALVIADDVSQNALSTFIGVFIYSVVALVALMNGYYEQNGRFLLFSLTMLALMAVIITFVRWVDRIARLGRLSSVVEKVENAALCAIRKRQAAPTMCALPVAQDDIDAQTGKSVHAAGIGYVQHIDVQALQACAEKFRLAVRVCALPGTFVTPDRELARVRCEDPMLAEEGAAQIVKAFVVGRERVFDDDPRFGLVVLSEIASRALSPAVNDPGTAIEVIGAFVRLFSQWATPPRDEDIRPVRHDRVQVPELVLSDLFDDAFTPIARDGASAVEVQIRLRKALQTLAAQGDGMMRKEAGRHARLALARAEGAMSLAHDIDAIREAGKENLSV